MPTVTGVKIDTLLASGGPVFHLGSLPDATRTTVRSAHAAGRLIRVLPGTYVPTELKDDLMTCCMLLLLTAALLTFVTALLHSIVPGFLVSITDALAALITAIVSAIWALLVLIGGIVAAVRVLRLGPQGGGGSLTRSAPSGGASSGEAQPGRRTRG